MLLNELLELTSDNQLLITALRAADVAGEVIRTGYGKLETVSVKAVGDLVSEVDLEADRVIADVLSKATSIPILSEELAAEQPVVDDMWIVDPLDASSAFLMRAGREYPAVLIALRQGGTTEIGVAYFPLIGQWYHAIRGRGAWRNGVRLVCDCDERLSSVWVEMNQYGDASLETEFFATMRDRLRSIYGARLTTCNVPNSGVALRLATCENALAAAIHDNNPDNVKQAAWDIAAPQLILEEAGGVFVNPRGQRSDPFRAEPIIVARSSQLARDLVELGQAVQRSKAAV